jgi:hypothetical protein
METNLPQLNITIDTLTTMVVVEEHHPFTDNLHASLADLLGSPKEIACAAPAEILAPPNVPPEEIGAGPCVRIAGYWHNSLIEGPGRRSTVKLQGCTIQCVGCITPDSWAPKLGHLVPVDLLADVLLDRTYERNGISILEASRSSSLKRCLPWCGPSEGMDAATSWPTLATRTSD